MSLDKQSLSRFSKLSVVILGIENELEFDLYHIKIVPENMLDSSYFCKSQNFQRIKS